jgi:hypothetical protein
MMEKHVNQDGSVRLILTLDDRELAEIKLHETKQQLKQAQLLNTQLRDTLTKIQQSYTSVLRFLYRVAVIACLYICFL